MNYSLLAFRRGKMKARPVMGRRVLADVIRRRAGLVCLVAVLCSATDLLPTFTALAATVDASHEVRLVRHERNATLRLHHARVEGDSLCRWIFHHGKSTSSLSGEARQEPDHVLGFAAGGICEELLDKGLVLRLRTQEDRSSQFLKVAPQFTLSLCHAANCFAEHTNAPLQPQSAFLMSHSVSLLI